MFQFHKIIYVFVLSFIINFIITPIISKIAVLFTIMDIPDGKLKNHENAVPYLGGLAIFISFFISLSFFKIFDFSLFYLFIGLTILQIIGLIDDIFIINPLQKLIGQSISVLFFLIGGNYFKIFPINFLNLFLSFFWYLSIINAFNLVDVMDGLTSIIAICITSFLLIFSIILNQFYLSIILASFLGVLLAFFYYNAPPAKIYLGDAGSLTIGGFLAGISMFLNYKTDFFSVFVCLTIVFGIPLIELATLILIRSYKKIPFYMGSPDHFAIYLRNKGWGKLRILSYVFFISLFLFSLSTLYCFSYIGFVFLIVLITLLIFFWFFMIFMQQK